MRITNWKHFPWFIFVCLATIGAAFLYVGNFHPQRMPAGIRLPAALIQTPTEHHTVGGTPLGLAFGAISLGIFVFAALLSLRKKIPLWRIGTVQKWLRAHIWLTLLTLPLVLFHSNFRLGGPMTTLLMGLYAIVMVSGIYGLVLQHLMPRLMKERLPAETVFEQIPHIRTQLCLAAEKMRDSFKPAPPKKPDPSASGPAIPSAANAVTPSAPSKPAETIGTPTPEVQREPPGAPEKSIAASPSSPTPPPRPAESADPEPTAPTAPKPAAPAAPKPAATSALKPAAAPPPDPASEAALVEIIDRQVLPYLRARRGERFRLGNARFSDDTFRLVKLRVSETYRSRVEEMQAWCDERRLLDLQTRLQHWLHGWLLIHVPFSFLLLLLTIWHAYVTLFYY